MCNKLTKLENRVSRIEKTLGLCGEKMCCHCGEGKRKWRTMEFDRYNFENGEIVPKWKHSAAVWNGRHTCLCPMTIHDLDKQICGLRSEVNEGTRIIKEMQRATKLLSLPEKDQVVYKQTLEQNEGLVATIKKERAEHDKKYDEIYQENRELQREKRIWGMSNSGAKVALLEAETKIDRLEREKEELRKERRDIINGKWDEGGENLVNAHGDIKRAHYKIEDLTYKIEKLKKENHNLREGLPLMEENQRLNNLIDELKDKLNNYEK